MEATVDVVLPLYNEEDSLPDCLASIQEQTISIDHVWAVDGGSTDRTPEILRQWSNRLPLKILHNERRRQAPGLNMAIERAEAAYLARMDGHTTWSSNYLETLVQVLEEEPDLAAAGAPVRCHSDSNQFQRNVWAFMCHVLGTGGPSYREGVDSPKDVPSVQSPVYRQQAIADAGGFRENLPWAEDDELHVRLRNRGWTLRLDPRATLYYLPRRSYRGVFRQMNHYGRGRGQLGRRGIFPSRRHRIIDRLLIIWTLGLVWNPVGWGFGFFYSLFLFVIVFQQWMEDNGGFPLLLLFPGGQISYWLGWLSTRFRAGPDAAGSLSGGSDRNP